MEKKTKILIGVFATLTVAGLAWWGINIRNKRKAEKEVEEVEKEVATKPTTGTTTKPAPVANSSVIGKKAYARALKDTSAGSYSNETVYRTAKVYEDSTLRKIIREVKKDEFIGTIVGEVDINGNIYYELLRSGTFGGGGYVLKVSSYTK